MKNNKTLDWINQQNWCAKKKYNARYRWKLRYAPETIRKRKKECPICYTMQSFIEFGKPEEEKCVHHATICQSCCKRMNKCPYCREIWQERLIINLIIDDDIRIIFIFQ